MDLLTQQKAASMLNVSVRTINRMRQNGQLDTIRLAYRTIRIKKLDVERLIEGSKCHKRSHQGCTKRKAASGTLSIPKTVEAKDIHFARKIWKQRQIVSVNG